MEHLDHKDQQGPAGAIDLIYSGNNEYFMLGLLELKKLLQITTEKFWSLFSR